jgi:8-oxo-dGTP diphosphatase
MDNHKLFKIDQNAIIRNKDNRILILQKNEKWLLPGGRLNENETWEQGLRREVEQETGINDFTIKEISNVDINDEKDTYIVVFICEIESVPEIKLSYEHQKYEWLDLKEIDKYEFWHEKIKQRILTSF